MSVMDPQVRRGVYAHCLCLWHTEADRVADNAPGPWSNQPSRHPASEPLRSLREEPLSLTGADCCGTMERFLCMMRALMLGLSVALTSTLTPPVSGQELHPCLTEEKNLRMDCTFERSNITIQPYCEFRQDGKLLGTTEPRNQLTPEQGKQINVTLHEPNVCRLTMAIISEKASTYTCRVLQNDSREKSMALHMKTLPTCSAASSVFQGMPSLLLTLMSLLVLLGILNAY
ncbi:hypothetical protein GN956_G8021 [Arapaima gigas]